MMTYTRFVARAACAALAAASFLSAQTIPETAPAKVQDRAASRFDLSKPGLAGSRKGTQLWIGTMKKHLYDLSAVRNAIRDGTIADAGPKAVARYVRLVEQEQAGFEQKLDALGARILRRWWLIHGCLIEIPSDAIAKVAALPELATFEPNVMHAMLGGSGAAVIPFATNSQNHNADAVQASGERGAGALVSIMDGSFDTNYQNTGLPHQIFYRNSVKTAANLLLPAANIHKVGSQAVNLNNPHGTAVASIAAGSAWSGLNNSDGHAPHAPKVVYSIADQANGNSSTATMASAWNRMALHKSTNVHNIKVANNSYSGSPNPTNAVQQALDALANDLDVLITVAAGNDGLLPNPAANSQSACNGLAVASCSSFSKNIVQTSSYGPLPGAPNVNRTWPDITGVGGFATTALYGNENSYYQNGGTSFAAPQVAGAAALVRSANQGLTALQTKAILLASTESIAAQNPGRGENNYGQGFSRDDLAVDLARRAATNVATGFHNNNAGAAADWTIPMEVTAGSTYSVACAWNRTAPYNNTNWSNFSLQVIQYSPTFQVLVTAPSRRNLYRRISFTAPLTGRVWIVCRSVTVQHIAQPNYFAVAHTGDSREGNVTPYGQGCAGTGPVAGGAILPAANATAMGNARSIWPWTTSTTGSTNLRVQQLLLGSEQPVSRTYTGVSFRQDNSIANPPGGRVEIEIRMGYSTRGLNNLSSTFASNFSGAVTTVLPRQWVTLPSIPAAANNNPSNFLLTVPFITPFSYVPAAGRNVLIEFTIYTNERRDSGVTTANAFEPKSRYWTDSVTGGNTSIVRGVGTFGFRHGHGGFRFGAAHGVREWCRGNASAHPHRLARHRSAHHPLGRARPPELGRLPERRALEDHLAEPASAAEPRAARCTRLLHVGVRRSVALLADRLSGSLPLHVGHPGQHGERRSQGLRAVRLDRRRRQRARARCIAGARDRSRRRWDSLVVRHSETRGEDMRSMRLSVAALLLASVLPGQNPSPSVGSTTHFVRGPLDGGRQAHRQGQHARVQSRRADRDGASRVQV